MKTALFLISILLLYACDTQDPNAQIEYLDGYWTIERVRLANGTEKEFSLSTTVDFIEVNGNSGLRKKMQPKLDGSFITSDKAETFQLKIENDSLRMYYTTPYDSWKETVLIAKDSSLVVVNRDGNSYFYKRFKKFEF